MERRRLILVAASFCLVAIVFWWLWPTPGITSANCNRIKEGMTDEQVDAIFGRPEGYYCSPDAPVFMYVGSFGVEDMPRWREGAKVKVWYNDSGIARVLFDRNGLVVGKAWSDNPSVAKRNWVAKLWDRIKEWWSPTVMPSTMPMTSPVRPASTAPTSS
jgi:hypothetical protein